MVNASYTRNMFVFNKNNNDKILKELWFQHNQQKEPEHFSDGKIVRKILILTLP